MIRKRLFTIFVSAVACASVCLAPCAEEMGNYGTDMPYTFASMGGSSINVPSFEELDTDMSLDTSGFSVSQDINSLAASNGVTGFGEGLDMSLDLSSSLDMDSADQYFKKTLGENYSGIDANLTSISMPEGINFESLNTQYANMQVEFANSKKELKTDVTMPTLNGYSGDSAKVFKESFGNVADSLKISSYSIPSSFNVNNMLDQAEADKSSLFASVKSSSAFQTVNSNLTHGEIFAKAKAGVSLSTLEAKAKAQGMNDQDISDYAGLVQGLISVKDKANLSNFKNNQSTAARENASRSADNFANSNTQYENDSSVLNQKGAHSWPARFANWLTGN